MYLSSSAGENSIESIELKAAQIRQLYTQTRAGLIGAMVSAIILVAALRDVVPLWHLFAWLGFYTLIQMHRQALIWGFNRRFIEGRAVLPWGTWFALTTALSGLAWGAAGVFLFPENSLPHQLLLSLFIAGISAAAAVIYSPTVECYLPTVLAMLIPLGGRYLYVGGELHVTMGCVIFIFALVLALSGKRMHLTNLASLKLSFERSGLVDSLTQEKEKAEKLNADLRKEIAERKRTEVALHESERRYRSLFEDSPVSIWEVDISELKAYLDGLNQSGTKDLSRFFEDRPDEVLGCLDMAEILDVNKTTLEQYGASTKEQLINQVGTVLHRDSVPGIIAALEAVAQGKSQFQCEMQDRTLEGRKRDIVLKAFIPIDTDDAYSRVIVSILDVSDLKKAEETIRESLKEKEILVREIHHRVKNNLQVISSLFSLQARYIQDAEYQRVFHESRNRLQTMAYVHERLYSSEDLSSIEFSKYISDLANNLFHFFGVSRNRISLRLEIEPVAMSVDSAIPCGLIANELISNCLKHAFPGDKPGTITIALRDKKGGLLEFVISDDGIGLPVGLNTESTETLGLRLVKTLTKQLRGKIEIHARRWTTFAITFRQDRPREEIQGSRVLQSG